MATKEQNGLSEGVPAMHSNALSAFERNCGRTQRHTVEHRSSQPAPRAVAVAGPRSPSLPTMRRGGYLRSNVECTVERKNISAFERRACIRTQAHDLSSHLVL
jgi:hypothetical protein